jgi:alanine dehydrogenase
MITSSDAFKSFKGSLLPQEEMLEIERKQSQLAIGIPKETNFQENRVALGPAAVGLLVNNGHHVIVQRGAGVEANFSDKDYSEAGATIVEDAKTVFEADLLVKVVPPSLEEVELMKRGQTLISALQIATHPKNLIQKLMEKKVTAVAWDFIMDEVGTLPVVRSMGEIAGTTSILIASEYLSKAQNGQGLMLGGLTGVAPASVVILGAGTVAEFACRAALGLGAAVKVFDDSIYKLNRLQNSLDQRIFTSTLQPKDLIKALKRADVVIGAIRAPKGRTPCIVTEEMVSEMKEGSMIVDVSIDQGGCFETSEVTTLEAPVFKKYGVTHYCVPNIASRVSRTASCALSNIFAPILINVGESGGAGNFLRRNAGFRNGVYIFKGVLTNEYLGKTLNIPFKDINLLIAAF